MSLSVCVKRVYCKVVVYIYLRCFRGASDVRYSRCRNRARVGLSVGISVTVSVPSNKVRAVVYLGSQSRLVGCQVSRKLVALVSSKSVWL